METLVFKSYEGAQKYAQSLDPYHIESGETMTGNGQESCLRVLDEGGQTTHLFIISESEYEESPLFERGE